MLNSFLKGPSLRSLSASVRARNHLKPVEAAPRPSAAALVSTYSRGAIKPTALEAVIAGLIAGVAGGATNGTGCIIPCLCLLKSSSMI